VVTLNQRNRYELPTVLCLAAFGVFLCAAVTFGSFPGQTATTQHNRKTVAPQVKSDGLVEEFSFLIKDFKIDHQGETNNLNITIRYRYKAQISNAEYPDFTAVARDIETLLTNYPNEQDYWEIMNKRITLMVLEKYSPIASITSELQVSPSPKNLYLRSSIVRRERATVRKRTTQR